jgi:hypothetical protein
MPATPLAKKLLFKTGTTLALVNAPAAQAALFEDVARAPRVAGASVALLYAANAKELAAHLPATKKALGAEARLWIAYPKAGKAGTDLNRDLLRERLDAEGLEAVRQVALDDTWSAMMFKRA